MGRASTKEHKTKYQLIREELGLSREISVCGILLDCCCKEDCAVTEDGAENLVMRMCCNSCRRSSFC